VCIAKSWNIKFLLPPTNNKYRFASESALLSRERAQKRAAASKAAVPSRDKTRNYRRPRCGGGGGGGGGGIERHHRHFDISTPRRAAPFLHPVETVRSTAIEQYDHLHFAAALEVKESHGRIFCATFGLPLWPFPSLFSLSLSLSLSLSSCPQQEGNLGQKRIAGIMEISKSINPPIRAPFCRPVSFGSRLNRELIR